MRALMNIKQNHEDLYEKFSWKNVEGGVRMWNEEQPKREQAKKPVIAIDETENIIMYSAFMN